MLGLPSQQAEAAALCLCSYRVHWHAEYRGTVHLHCRPTAAALCDLLHWGAWGSYHNRIWLRKHWLPRGWFPKGKKLTSLGALPLPWSHLMCETFAMCGRGRRMCVCVCVCKIGFWDDCSSSLRRFGYVPSSTISLKQSWMQADVPCQDCSTGSTELFQEHIYWVSTPQGLTGKCGQYKLRPSVPLGRFSHCTMNCMSPADDDTALRTAATAPGPLLAGHLASVY